MRAQRCFLAIALFVTQLVPVQAQERGIVFIKSEPEGAAVFLNGQDTGRKTPFQEALAPGDYTYRLEFEMYVPHEGRFNLRANTTERLELTLKPNFGNLTIESSPSGASVYIDGENTYYKTPYQARLAPGEHEYRLEYDLYHPLEGTFQLAAGAAERLGLRLLPNFGTLRVESNPAGAEVRLDGQSIGRTPLTRHELRSGSYRLEVAADMYEPLRTDIAISDEQTTSLSYDLTAGFGTIGVVALPEAEIWIDGNRMGTGVYSGRLAAGRHRLEVRREGYYSEYRDLDIAAETQTTERIALKPVVGYLSVITEPPEADVYVDGRKLPGTSPLIDTLMTGRRQLQVRLREHALYETAVEIREKQTEHLNIRLILGKSFTVNTEPAGATVWLDGREVGTTPLAYGAPAGRYRLKVELPFYTPQETEINIVREDQRFEFNLLPLGRLLRIRTTPEKAGVYIEGQLRGTTPAEFILLEGAHRLRIEKKNYQTLEAGIVHSEASPTYHYLLEPLKYRSRGGALLWTLVMPGAGHTHLRRGGAAFLMGVSAWGLLGGSYVMNMKAVESYDAYLASTRPEERAALRDDWQRQDAMSKNMLYAAGAVWIGNLIWTIAMPSEEARYRKLRVSPAFNNATGAAGVRVGMIIGN